MKRVLVRKMNGSVQPFSPAKLKRSLSNSGADKEIINVIMKKVEKFVYDGISTRKLYRFVFREMKRHKPSLAAKYDLRNSLLRLGPEGYPFESFVAKIMEKRGYMTKLNTIVRGKFVSHEIDVIASKNSEKVMVECKHHRKAWIYSDIQTALYTYARFLDVKKNFTKPMIVTNTRFSRQAMRYAKGVRMWLMGWKCPANDGLEKNIERFKLYPLTMMTCLNDNDIKKFTDHGLILVKTISEMDTAHIRKILGVSDSKANKIVQEAKGLCC